MAELITLARPYAKAAFAYACENQQLQQWCEALALAAAVIGDDRVSKMIDSPTVTAKQKAKHISDFCAESFDESIQRFVAVIAENNRLGLLVSISELFNQLKANYERFSDVQVVSAFVVDEPVQTALMEKLKTVLSTDVSLTISVDSSLLGGVVVRAGDTVIDGSIRGRLNKLGESLSF